MLKTNEKVLIFSASENLEDGQIFIKIPSGVASWKTFSINFIDALNSAGYGIYEIPITKELDNIGEIERYVSKKLKLKRLPNGIT